MTVEKQKEMKSFHAGVHSKAKNKSVLMIMIKIMVMIAFRSRRSWLLVESEKSIMMDNQTKIVPYSLSKCIMGILSFLEQCIVRF